MPIIQMQSTAQPDIIFNSYSSSQTSGIYVAWDRISTTNVTSYNILSSSHIDGTYTLLANTLFPNNDYVDTSGAPSSYYKIQELDSNNNVLATSIPITGEELLIKASLAYEIKDFLRVPVYEEMATFSQDRKRARWAFNNWNSLPSPEIRISASAGDGISDSFITLNGNTNLTSTINGNTTYPSGLQCYLDYQGQGYFVNNNGTATAVNFYDNVWASYNVRLFTGSEMNHALEMALNTINSMPGSNKYQTIVSTPYYYDPALITGATYYLLRQLLVRLNQRETRLLLQDPENGAFDSISSLRETTKMYKEDFDNFLKNLPKAKYPSMYSIVTSEYMLPGGRSRFFRAIWTGGQ